MKHLIRHIATIIGTALLILAGGCAEEAVTPPSGKECKLILSVNLREGVSSQSGRDFATTRAGEFDNFDNENDKWGIEGENMEELRIIITDADGMVEHNAHFDASNATLLGKYEFKVSQGEKNVVLVSNEKEYSVDKEGMEIAGGVQSLTQHLAAFTPGSRLDIAALRKLTVALEHNSVDRKEMSLPTPLPITAIYKETINETDVERTYLLHRAAVKYSFRIVNLSKYPHKLEGIRINGITDREYLFPDAQYGDRHEVLSYNTPATAELGEYRTTLATPLQLPANMTKAVTAIPSFYVPEGIASDSIQKVSLAIDGIDLSVWRDLEWLMPGETETTKRPMNDLPRNSHVVVNITIKDNKIELIACVQPYTEISVEPWFGLDRDEDGNIITKRHEDGTYDVIIDGKKVLKDLDGDEVIKKFSDGSLFCREIVYKDYIHGDDEVDYEYPYEKDFSGGNMIVIRELSSGGTYHGDGMNESNHDHKDDDRAKFVLGRDGEFYRCDWTNIDPETKRPALLRTDVDGAEIIQCNGYQFRIITGETPDENITAMQKYIGTYLVEKDGKEELRYYKEDYNKAGALILNIELGMGDPKFQEKYPGVYNPKAAVVSGRSTRSISGSRLMRAVQAEWNRRFHKLKVTKQR